jgi:hypothetical protein
MQGLLPVLLAVHIALALGLFLPSLLLPFALRARRSAQESASPIVGGLLWLQSRGGIVIAIGLAVTGSALLAVLGTQLLSQPWLLVALGIYAANLAIAMFVQQPNLRRLVGVRAGSDDRIWSERARRQRYVSYAMAGLVGTIGILMSAKPQLW